MQRKDGELSEMQKVESELRAEHLILKKQFNDIDQEQIKHGEMISELTHAIEKARDSSFKCKKRNEELLKAISKAKKLMAAMLTVFYVTKLYFSVRKLTFYIIFLRFLG